ncbi:MAG TPA: helix-turn-helix transcriptional regulator [Acidimicrobiales bacterium]|nr:helix-turn-helix transcriptional regulator [Acidimicrobiales bacterium]
MKPAPTYTWQLRQVMAAHGLWKTSDLGPLLAERGVVLSPAQIYRLAAQVPERLSLHTLAALCDIFSCTPDELIETGVATPKPKVEQPEGTVLDLATVGRPRRARVTPDAL